MLPIEAEVLVHQSLIGAVEVLLMWRQPPSAVNFLIVIQSAADPGKVGHSECSEEPAFRTTPHRGLREASARKAMDFGNSRRIERQV